jgi:hypothetical protein
MVVLAIWLSMLGVNAHAVELYEDYYSIRAVGMGDAYSAVVDNDDAVFYNPAALCKASGFTFVLVDPSASVSGVTLLQDASTLSSASSSSLASTLQSFYGQDVSASVYTKTAVLLPCFEVAAYGGLSFAAKLDNPAYPNLYIRDYTDYGVAAGFGVDVVPGFATLGFTARRLDRLGNSLTLGPGIIGQLSSTALSNQLAGSGVGYALDSGFLLTVPGPVKPTLTAVYKNMGNTTFVKDSTLPTPPTVQNELILGAGFSVETLLLSIRPAFDLKHVTDQTVQLGDKVHAGVEIAIPFVALRAGLYQGYYTAGVGLNLGVLKIDAATWGVEMGEYPGQDESRRYGVEAKLEISFDADFGFSSFWGDGGKNGKGKGSKSGSSSSHLKQRR